MKTSFAALLSVAALVSTVAASPLGRLASRQSTESESTTIFDDGDSAISFDEGGWTHLTDQGNQWREGTESYTDNPSGCAVRQELQSINTWLILSLGQCLPRRLAHKWLRVQPQDVCLDALLNLSAQLMPGPDSWSGKKNDRGPFSVALINGTELGTGNAYADAGEPTTSEITFQQDK